MASYAAPWNAPKPQNNPVIEPVQEVVPEPVQVVEEPAPVVEEVAPVVEETPAPKKAAKKAEPTPAEE